MNIKILIITVFIILFFCDFSRGQAKNTQTGMASYYASEFHGRRTASGEKYNMNALTAAHPSLPFHTYVKVTNLSNDKSVIVRINDRGPHTKKRIIDLSKAAAKNIGLLKSGVGKVRVEVIDHDKLIQEQESDNKKADEPKVKTPEEAKPEASKPVVKENDTDKKEASKMEPGHYYNEKGKMVSLSGYVIQVGSFTEEENAAERLKELSSSNKNNFYCEVSKVKSKTVYRILSGSFKTKGDAQKELKSLKKSGIKGFIREI